VKPAPITQAKVMVDDVGFNSLKYNVDMKTARGQIFILHSPLISVKSKDPPFNG
jgi:hypothetical protein